MLGVVKYPAEWIISARAQPNDSALVIRPVGVSRTSVDGNVDECHALGMKLGGWRAMLKIAGFSVLLGVTVALSLLLSARPLIAQPGFVLDAVQKRLPGSGLPTSEPRRLSAVPVAGAAEDSLPGHTSEPAPIPARATSGEPLNDHDAPGSARPSERVSDGPPLMSLTLQEVTSPWPSVPRRQMWLSIEDIVDPWMKTDQQPLDVRELGLIVDPWAHEQPDY